MLYSTHRPEDYPMPYSTLERNGVPFNVEERRENKLGTILVRVCV